MLYVVLGTLVVLILAFGSLGMWARNRAGGYSTQTRPATQADRRRDARTQQGSRTPLFAGQIGRFFAGVAIAFIAVAAFCFDLWLFGFLPPKKAEAPKVVVNADEISHNYLYAKSPAGCAKVEKFWKEHLPGEEAALMTDISNRESGCNQFAHDGKTPLFVAEPDHTTSIGVMQINNRWEGQWKALGPDYSPYTTEGNLNMALWIYQHSGPRNWSTYKSARLSAFQEIEIEADKDTPTQAIYIGTRKFTVFPEGPIFTLTSDGRTVPGDKNLRYPSIGNTTTLAFQSRTNGKVKVRVTFS